MPRADHAVYEDAVAHPAHGDRSVEQVARRVGLDVAAVRVIVEKSPRLVMRGPMPGWSVVEVVDR
jgi:hypothetical protein